MHSKSHFMFAKLIFDMLRNEKKKYKKMRAGVGNSSLVHSPFVACLPVLPQHSIA